MAQTNELSLSKQETVSKFDIKKSAEDAGPQEHWQFAFLHAKHSF